jgi:putative ABC transport system permease protein
VPLASWAPHTPQLSDRELYISLAEGVSIEDGKAAVQPLADKYGAPDVQDRQEYIDLFSSQIDIFLIVIYFLLGLSIFIAVLGISNTLALSIYERTRELGLLRAVGETRSQLRSMVRWESAIIAVFGTFGGLLLGVFLGWGFMQAFKTDQGFGTFSAPIGQLVTIFVVGGVFGVLAGVLPARRAAKLNILDSIAADG